MSLRVLVVDDEPMIAHNLQAFLEDEGMQVQCAGSAEQAIDLVSSGADYEVCIMDLRLPGMDGNMAIQALHRLCPSLRFIIHTGSANYTLSDELRALGIAEAQLIRKPVLDMHLLAEMARNLAWMRAGS